jgi:hypothetical protein
MAFPWHMEDGHACKLAVTKHIDILTSFNRKPLQLPEIQNTIDPNRKPLQLPEIQNTIDPKVF